jgi:uncharacterized protein (DUF1697 family)
MQRYIAFLRGINLGKRRLQMKQLAVLFEKLGYKDVATFIASGNVLFSTPKKDANELESKISTHLEESLGYGVDTFVRTIEEVSAISKLRLFPEEGVEGITIHIGFLQRRLPPEIAKKFAAVRTTVDELRVMDREYYWLCRIRTPDSKVWALPEMRQLRLPTSTMRNLTSVRKLVAEHIDISDRDDSEPENANPMARRGGGRPLRR